MELAISTVDEALIGRVDVEVVVENIVLFMIIGLVVAVVEVVMIEPELVPI